MSLIKCDVAVIGAGVAGLNASWMLAKRGFKVVLVDAKPRDRIGDRACGDAIAEHHFDELGWRPPEKVIDIRYDGVKVISPSGKHEILVPGRGIGIRSLDFGQWMLKRALDSGVELLDQHVFLGADVSSDGVKKVYVMDRVKRILRRIEAKAYIDASGAVPALRTKLPRGWPIAERPYITDYNIAYREVTELDEPLDPMEARHAVIHLNPDIAPGGYWWHFPKHNGYVVNVGLGVVWSRERYDPRMRFEKFLRGIFKGKVVHRGGGLVPTRRPLPTLVWKNVCVVGDAAYTVNPIHGGGRASSMLSAAIIARHLAEVLEKGVVNEHTLWKANIDYMIAYGAKQASLDILRMFLQRLSTNDLEDIMSSGIVDGETIAAIGERGSLAEEVVSKLRALIKLLRRPSLLNKLRIVKRYMDIAKRMYLDKYPKTPSEFHKWLADVNKLFDEYRSLINYDTGPRVPW